MHIEIEKERLVIFDTDPVLRRKLDARIAILALSCTAGVFAIHDTYSNHHYSWNTILLGSIFAFFVFMVIFELLLPPPNSKRDNIINPELLVAESKGLMILTPDKIPTHYEWSEIAKVLLTNRLIHYSWGDRNTSWFVIIVYFKKRSALGFWRRTRKGIERSPEGFDVTYVEFPKQDMNLIEEAIARLSSRKVPVASFNEIGFRYGKRTEDYIP